MRRERHIISRLAHHRHDGVSAAVFEDPHPINTADSEAFVIELSADPLKVYRVELITILGCEV